ncbi:hypothetical protein ACROYT_G015136 [Oculina patagonica]
MWSFFGSSKQRASASQSTSRNARSDCSVATTKTAMDVEMATLVQREKVLENMHQEMNRAFGQRLGEMVMSAFPLWEQQKTSQKLIPVEEIVSKEKLVFVKHLSEKGRKVGEEAAVVIVHLVHSRSKPSLEVTESRVALNQDLSEISSWCCKNSLLINPDKTKLLVIGVPQLLCNLPRLSISIVFLLSWCIHI